MPTVHSTKFKTVVRDETKYEGDSLEAAIRTWDRETYDKARVVEGGVLVQSFRADGVMVRDGWVLHVSADGVAYLNPNLHLSQ